MTEHEDIEHESLEHQGLEHGSLEHQGLEHGSLEHQGVEDGSLEHQGLEHGSLEHQGLEHGSLEHQGLEHREPAQYSDIIQIERTKWKEKTESRQWKATCLTVANIKFLREYFERTPYPDAEDVRSLSEALKVMEHVIKKWFEENRLKHNLPQMDPFLYKHPSDGTSYQCEMCLQEFDWFYKMVEHKKVCCNQGGNASNQGRQDGNQGKQDGYQGGQDGSQGENTGNQGEISLEVPIQIICAKKEHCNQGGKDGNQGKQDGNQGKQDGTQGKQDGNQGKQDSNQGKQEGNQGKQDGTQGKQDGNQGEKDGQVEETKQRKPNLKATQLTDNHIRFLQNMFKRPAFPSTDVIKHTSDILNVREEVIKWWLQDAQRQEENKFSYQCAKCLQHFGWFYKLVEHKKTCCSEGGDNQGASDNNIYKQGIVLV